ncbi:MULTISPECIES: hypothetical protein [unclassified Ruegeria]|uniref:hypothetical protein n=1 Tax=unclassified Ruegeria TaxID=2625375 RepID=UPI001488AD40|nr:MULTISPECIES: hypothetical protein [unclassified Ruegeria]
MKFVAPVVFLLFIGCNSVVPGTVRQLTDVDPLTARPSDIALKLELPSALGVRPDSGRIELSGHGADGSISKRFVLHEVDDGVFLIADQDIERFQSVQQEISRMKMEDPEGTKGSLSLSFGPCLNHPTDIDQERLTVAIRLSQEGEFLPLLVDVPARTVMNNVVSSELPECADASTKI